MVVSRKWVEISILGELGPVTPLQGTLHQGVVGDRFVEKPLLCVEENDM